MQELQKKGKKIDKLKKQNAKFLRENIRLQVKPTIFVQEVPVNNPKDNNEEVEDVANQVVEVEVEVKEEVIDKPVKSDSPNDNNPNNPDYIQVDKNPKVVVVTVNNPNNDNRNVDIEEDVEEIAIKVNNPNDLNSKVEFVKVNGQLKHLKQVVQDQDQQSRRSKSRNSRLNGPVPCSGGSL